VLLVGGFEYPLTHGDWLWFGGPANVVRGSQHLRNPFRYVFLDDDPTAAVAEPGVVVQRKRQREPCSASGFAATRSRTRHDAATKAHEQATQAAQEAQEAQESQESLCNELKCSICVDFIIDPHSLMCAHTFCCECISEWFKKNPYNETCPECRAKVNRHPTPCLKLSKIIETLVKPMQSAEERADRAERITSWEQRKIETQIGAEAGRRRRAAVLRVIEQVAAHHVQMAG
jgi:hypothetical protein